MRSKPPLATGLLSGVVIGVTLLAVQFILARAVVQQSVGLNLVVATVLLLSSLPLLALWVYGMAELLTLRYTIDRNGVSVSTILRRHTVPHADIRELAPGQPIESATVFRGVSWPGFLRGAIRHPHLGPMIVLATEPLERQLILTTQGVSYGISPQDPAGFLQSYARYQQLGPLENLSHETQARTVATWPVWQDRVFWIAVGLGLFANLVLAAYAIALYEQLPTIVPIRWDAFGQIERLAPKSWVFTMPTIGVVAWAVNLCLGLALSFRERFASRLLAWASLAVQVGLWWTAWGILAT